MIINTAMNHKVEYDDKLNSVKNMNMNRNSLKPPRTVDRDICISKNYVHC
jgi:hypothetical protein